MKNIRSILMLITALGLASLPGRALAWGPEGHAIVAQIAGHFLTPTAQAKVQTILGDKKLDDYEVASWPDIIRGTKESEAIYPHNGKWHYVDFDAAQLYTNDFKLKLPEDGQDVVDQILRWRNELVSKNDSPGQKLDALRFLVHFVGDVHQPLHCAFRYGDKGGNMIPVHSFHGEHYSFDVDTTLLDHAPNLHSVWDEYLVYDLMAGLQPEVFANQLAGEINPAQLQGWRRDTEPLKWAVDGYWLARKQAYRWTDGTNLPVIWTPPGLDLTRENYIDSHLSIVREQLKKAGVHLASLLNGALDPQSAPPAVPPAETKD